MNKKRLIIVCATVVSVILIVSISMLFYHFNKNDDEIVIYDNVYVLSEIENVIDVDENTISFLNDMGYKEGDIIVSGITEKSPDGFIRKIVSVENKNNNYYYETEPAVLTEVFKKAHFSNKIQLLDDSSDVIGLSYTEKYSDLYDSEITLSNTRSTPVYADTTSLVSLLGKKNAKETDDREMLFRKEFETDFDDDINVYGEVGIDLWLEIELYINKGNIEFSLIANNEFMGEVFLGCKEEVFDKDKGEGEREYPIYKKRLPNIQFYIGYIPIVITNEFKAAIEASVQMEGEIGTQVSIGSKWSNGFKYSSRTGKVEEVNDSEYYSDGVKWKTTVNSEGKADVGVHAHLISKLYGSTGVDMSVGIVGGVLGEVGLELDYLGEIIDYYGQLDLYIKPQAKGNLVISVPIIDRKLKESPLFVINMKPLWTKNWKNERDNNVANLYNKYTTKYPDVMGVNEPIFEFSYPDNWKVIAESVTNNCESVTLINESGIKIQYYRTNYSFPPYYAADDYVYANLIYFADSSLDANYLYSKYPSYLDGKFIVCKLQEESRMDRFTGEGKEGNKNNRWLAVVPETYIGEKVFVGMGHYNVFQWTLSSEIWNEPFTTSSSSSPYIVFCTEIFEEYTEKELQEIIEILSSFRVKK